MTGKSLFSALLLLLIIAMPSDHAAAKTAEEQSYVFSENAMALFNQGDYRAAIIQLKNSIQKNPRNIAARILLGRAYLRLGQGELAERQLLFAQRNGAHPNLVIVPLGRTYLLQRKYKEIFKQIRPGRRGNRIEAEILGLRGTAYFAQRNLKKADEAFGAASRLQPNRAFPLLGQTRINVTLGNLNEAAPLIERALVLEPNNADAWYEKAELQRAQSNITGAAESYGKAIELRLHHLAARLGRASAFIALRRDKEALADIQYVRSAAPRETRAAYLQSIILTRAGKANEAQAVLAEAEQILQKRSPEFIRNHPPSLLLLGVIGYARENYEDAYHHLRRYVELDPYHSGSRKLLGSILLRKDDTWAAIKIMKPALLLAPKDTELLTLLGNAYMRVKQFSDATEMLEKAVAIAPENAGIFTQLGLSRLADGQSEKAVGNLETALTLTPDGSRPDLMLGLVLLKNRRFDDAIRTAKAISKRDPQNPFAHNLAGAAELAKGNLKKARSHFETAIITDANFAPAYFNLAKLDMAEGKAEDAKKRYAEILKIRPKNIKAMDALARIALLQNKLDDAIGILKEITILDPDTAERQTLLVDTYVRQNRIEAALNLAHDLEITHPTSIDVLRTLGRTLLLTHRYPAAALRFRRVAELIQPTPSALNDIARLQQAARDIEGARDTLRKVISIDPAFLPARIALIRFEANEKDIEKAISLVDELRKSNPDFREGDMVAGSLFMRARRYDEAIAAFSDALAKVENTDAVMRLYEAKYRAGQRDDAFDGLAKWVARKPEDLSAQRLLASAHRRAGRLDEAIKLNEHLLTLRPSDAVVLNNLAGLYQKKGDPRALSFAERAHRQAPNHPVMLDTLGWLLVSTGEVERGLNLLRQAFTRAADSAEVRYHLAVALNLSGRKDEARQELEKALESGDAFDGIAEAKTLLQALHSAQ